jgi:type IV pilus assembly protein PilE
VKSTTLTCKSLSRGFTLIELMVTIVIVAILAAIAGPSYTSQVRKSRRTEARTALLDAAAREERYFATNNFYTTLPANLGYGAAFPVIIGSQYYNLNVTCTGAAAAGTNCSGGFLAAATAINTQAKDTACASLTVDNTGAQGATGTDPNAATTCWN